MLSADEPEHGAPHEGCPDDLTLILKVENPTLFQAWDAGAHCAERAEDRHFSLMEGTHL